jgi:hypothetical protein
MDSFEAVCYWLWLYFSHTNMYHRRAGMGSVSVVLCMLEGIIIIRLVKIVDLHYLLPSLMPHCPPCLPSAKAPISRPFSRPFHHTHAVLSNHMHGVLHLLDLPILHRLL